MCSNGVEVVSDQEQTTISGPNLNTDQEATHSYNNGTMLGQARLASLLTKDNLGTAIILALAAEVFGVTDKMLVLFAGVC